MNNLKPAEVFSHFSEILKVPRPSKKEGKMIEFLMSFAQKHNLKAKTDIAGNVLIEKNATKGYENKKTVVLQSHIDMVCEKNKSTVHNFETDPIIPVIDEEWLKAKDTTLGADDGIGIAAQLAVLSTENLSHGPVECLFTVDEETGLTGAFALQPGFFTGKTLINLDSEDEGELFIGCAGGKDTIANISYTKTAPDNPGVFYKLAVTNLTGGHSGDDIHKGYANANKIAVRFLSEINDRYGLELAHFDGGNLRNAIAREAEAVFCVNNKASGDTEKLFGDFYETLKSEFNVTEPNFTATLSKCPDPGYVIDKISQFNILNAIYACPHGVISWSLEMPGLVETSTNLASVKFLENNLVEITTSQRSSVESSKNDIVNMVASVFRLAGFTVRHSEGYPGWKPNPRSTILNITTNSYKKLFGIEPVVRAIHAGLECGLFLEKYPELDMISFGPTIKAVHSPGEKLHIPSVDKFWRLLKDVLLNTE